MTTTRTEGFTPIGDGHQVLSLAGAEGRGNIDVSLTDSGFNNQFFKIGRVGEQVLTAFQQPVMPPDTSAEGVRNAYNNLVRDLNLDNIPNLSPAARAMFTTGIFRALTTGNPAELQSSIQTINQGLANLAQPQRDAQFAALQTAVGRFNTAMNSDQGNLAVNTGIGLSIDTNAAGIAGMTLGFDAATAAPHVRTRIPHNGSISLQLNARPQNQVTTAVSGWGDLQPGGGFSATPTQVLSRMRDRLAARGLQAWLQENPLP